MNRHEWTDPVSQRPIAVGVTRAGAHASRPWTFDEAIREILRLAGEVKSLKNSETVLVQERWQERAEEWESQARALAAERDRVAEEVERLREENRVLRAAPPALITLDDHDQLTAEAVAAECVRIRRELLAWDEASQTPLQSIGKRSGGGRKNYETFWQALNRICPEEG